MIISLISNYFEEAKKYDIFLMEVIIMINEKKGIQNGDKMNYNDYTFIFVPDGVPLRFPKLTMSCLYFPWDYDCF